MRTVILVGGFGSRLKEIVSDRPKPMADFFGKPFLEYQLLLLKKYGLTDVVLCTGFMSEYIQSYFKEGRSLGINISYSIETSPLGTGGAIKKALNKLDDVFLVLNGDTLLNFNYFDMISKFNVEDQDVVIAIKKIKSSGARYGSVWVDKEMRITSFREKISNKPESCQYINAGLYMINKKSINWNIYSDNFSLEKNVLPDVAKRGRLYGYLYTGYFIDIGIKESFYEFKNFLKHGGLKLE